MPTRPSATPSSQQADQPADSAAGAPAAPAGSSPSFQNIRSCRGGLRACAPAGDPEAQAELGRRLLAGTGRPARQAEGVCLLSQAGLAGSLGAMLDLARWHLSRTPGQSLGMAFFWLSRALATGSAEALELGGDAVLALNPGAAREAARFYEAGAGRDSPDCHAKLLELRLSGRLGALPPRERKACLAQLEKLAREGSLPAAKALGLHCAARLKRRGMRKACMGWLRLGARQGERTCQRLLAVMLAGSGTGPRAMAKAWLWLEQAAAGDPEAQYLAGIWLAEGRGRRADPAAAERMLRLASASLAKALVPLGLLLARDGDPGRRQEGTAMLREACQSTPGDAWCALGVLAREAGRDGEARFSFRQAGLHGESLRRLAEMASCEQERKEAPALMAQAASLGDVPAMVACARRLLRQAAEPGRDGAVVLRFRREACRLLEGAAVQDDPQALHELACLAASGLPGAPDPARAPGLHARAAALGHAGSMEIRADELLARAAQEARDADGAEDGKKPGLRSGRLAAGFLRRAMDKGSPTAAWKYGLMLEEGAFVAQNLPRAIDCYDKAGRAGLMEGKHSLGRLLLKTAGPDDARAWEALAASAGLGHREDRTAVAVRFLAGGSREGCPPWLEEHLRRLSGQGCAEGKRLLSSAIVQGRIAPLSPGEAYALLIEAAEGGDADACLLLGDRHARGDGIDQNCEKARRCYARARDLGRKEEAEERLARLPRPDGAAPWLAGRGRDAAGGR